MNTKTKSILAAAAIVAFASPALAVTQESDLVDSGRYVQEPTPLRGAYAQQHVDTRHVQRSLPFHVQEEVWFERASGPIEAN
ncbi:MAG TPA: hypothetical protein VHA77_17805 [Xanthobacteraceae bacterium]|nr:hypothetical protein [Xanthobacteraceae bacterium]